MRSAAFRVIHFAPVILLVAISALPGRTQPAPAPIQQRHYSVDELLVLNQVGGFGDVGKADTDPAVTAPGSKLPFSLSFAFEHPAGGAGFWSIRIALPDSIRINDYTGFACDLRIDSADPGANLTLMLIESDDDRWVCRGGGVTSLGTGAWQHLKVGRSAMSPWLIGNGKAEWERINTVAIEPSGGRVSFHIANVRLTGPGGKSFEVLNTADDGLYADPAWHVPVRIPPPGTVYFPGLSRLNLLEAGSPQGFKGLLDHLGTSAFGAAAVDQLRAAGVETFYYSQYAANWARFLTRRQGWDRNAAGESPNDIPRFVKWLTGEHCIAYASPAVTEIGMRTVSALVKSGIGAWMLVDYTFPWSGGPFGYSQDMERAYQVDLAGADSGLHTRDRGQERVVHFPDYFRDYNGFYPRPADVGLQSWNGYIPPQPSASDPASSARRILFLYLRSYEWLKLPDRVGRRFQAEGGHGAWIVPNPEDTWGSSDYVFMVRSAGARNLFPEWFGNGGILAEGGFASLPGLRQEADRSGGRLSAIFETGAGGHAAPYWDWRVAYTTAYVLCAASRADDFDNDFLDETTFDQMRKPENKVQFARFRDGVTKAKAFLNARLESPVPAPRPILCVSMRPPAHACGSIFYSLSEPYSLGLALSRTHLPFDLRDSLDLESALKGRRMVVFCPMAPRVGDLSRLKTWLTQQPGRVLVTHTFVPSRSADGWWGMDRGSGLGQAPGGELLGLGRITAGTSTSCTVTGAMGVFKDEFPAGLRIDLPLTAAEHGETLVSATAGPLISRVQVGRSQVIYLHFAAEDPASPTAADLNLRAVRSICQMMGISPACQADAETPVQLFRSGGGFVVTAWDGPTLERWKFKYEAGIPIQGYEAPGVSRTIRLPTGTGQGDWLVYDFWNDRLEHAPPAPDGVKLELRDAVVGMWYAGPDSPAFATSVARAREARAWLRQQGFDGAR